MNLPAKTPFPCLWIVFMLAALGMVMLSPVSLAVTIGDEYGGGIVFYVDGTGQHGLIAAKEDLPGHSSGKDEGHFTWYDALSACSDYVPNGYSDWFLPNKEQLTQLYRQKSVIGGFAVDYYWSSSDYSAYFTPGRGSISGFRSGINKYYSNRVRPVRAF